MAQLFSSCITGLDENRVTFKKRSGLYRIQVHNLRIESRAGALTYPLESTPGLLQGNNCSFIPGFSKSRRCYEPDITVIIGEQRQRESISP